MAPVPPMKSPVALAIEAHYRDVQEPRDDATLRCSKIGEECERSLWYSFRWTTPLKRHDGRVERLFQTGHREEDRMIRDLRVIGCSVDGTQDDVSFLRGILTGHIDGRVIGVPGAEKTEHLLECKTHNQKSFDEWKVKGVEAAKPVHYAQMQIYMHGLGLTRALYLAHNKNTDEVESERVKYDPLFAEKLVAKAERIAFADRPPPKQESFACRWCKHEKICRYDDWPRFNCLTCLHANLLKHGEWECTRHLRALSIAEQKAGCASHLYIPDLVPGEQIDADERSATVTYNLRVRSGQELYVDGRDPKPIVLEVEE